MAACCTHTWSHSGAALGSISIRTENSTDVKISTVVGLFMQCLAFRTLHKPALRLNKLKLGHVISGLAIWIIVLHLMSCYCVM